MALGLDPVSFAVAFSAGFVSFASPCVLPLVPAYLSFVSGVGLTDETPRRRDVALPTGAFVAGFGAAFTALGAGAALFGGALLSHRRGLEVVGGIFVILMGLLLLGRGVPMMLMRERRVHLARRPVTLAGSALAGVAFAIGWTPCIGPTLAAALTLAAQEGSAGVGAALLAVYSLGLGVPFLLAGLFMHGAATAMAFLRRRLRLITAAGSIMLVVFGVLLATGELARLSARLNVVSLPI
jgi:cytochrome c-type biogenesis protein